MHQTETSHTSRSHNDAWYPYKYFRPNLNIKEAKANHGHLLVTFAEEVKKVPALMRLIFILKCRLNKIPLLASTEAIGVWGFAGSLRAFCAGSDLVSCGGSVKESVAAEGASSAATDAASLAMDRVVILPLRRPWLLAVFRPRGVLCSFPSSSSPPSHLSLSLLMSLQFRAKTQLKNNQEVSPHHFAISLNRWMHRSAISTKHFKNFA